MVEWKKLGEVCKRNKGIPITAGQMSELAVPNGNVRVFAAGQTIADINGADLPINCAYKKPSIIVKSRGYIDFEFYEKPFTHKNEMWSYSFDNKEQGKYIFYYLTTKTELFRKKARANSVKLPQLCVADTDNFYIPLPSLSEQERIVGILDTFTSSIENLKAQISLRRKQYEHYRDKLLDLEGKPGVEMKTLGEIGTFIRGKRFVRTDIVEEGVPCLHYGDFYTTYGLSAKETKTFLTTEKAAKLRFAEKNDVVIVAAGENNIDIGVGVVWFGEKPAAVHDACYIFKHKQNPMYISYYLRSNGYHQQIKKDVSSAKICSISSVGLGRAVLPLPSLEEQSRIVSILDEFEASIKNLEAQLEAREKQYEYYREKLLTFERE